MNKLILLLLAGLLLSGCTSIQSYETHNIYPDLDFVVYKKRLIQDSNGNKLHITLLGIKKRNVLSYENSTFRAKPVHRVDLYILWELKQKVSPTYKISFTANGEQSDFFIRTAADKIFPLKEVARGPVAPEILLASSGQGGLIILSFPDFHPEKNILFDLVEGGRGSVNTAAYSTYIKDPTRWSFFGCSAIRRDK